MGKGKGGGEFEVNEYLMSMHVGVCTSADALTGIYIGGKPAWLGDQTTEGNISINAPALFGGNKKEGGVQGTVRYLPGLPTQVLPDALAQKLGRANGADCPGFRGVTSLFFTGDYVTEDPFIWFTHYNTQAGFKWVANNPYMKDVWVGVRRAPKGLNPANAMIPRLGSNGLTPFVAGQPVGLNWFQSTYEQPGDGPNDKAAMGIGYFGADGEQIGDTQWASIIDTPAMVWTERSLTSTIPTGTYQIRIYMAMERMWGSYNDGYIDDISLTIGGSPVPLTNPGNETHNGYGWVEEVGGIGVRFSNPPTHSGTAYFTGGGFAYSRAYQALTQASTGEDANPAHMIYECLTNRDWGMGASSTIIDVSSFEAAGVTLLFERLGLSMVWTRQTTIEAFVSETLDHIQGVLYVNPRTGLITLKLIRGDYNVSELRRITPDNAKMKNFQRKSWGEITSEVVVTWTNPENEQEETVTLQDPAAIANQSGDIVSDSRNYYGVRTAELAMRLAARDLRVASTPLATCDVELDRTAWNLLPGEVVLVYWPERGLDDVPMRVGPVDYGKPGDMKITASLLEDIFGYATTDYSTPPASQWADDRPDPTPASHSKVITLPSFFAANYLPAAGTGLADIQYPEVLAGTLVTSPTALNYDLYGTKIAVDGSASIQSLLTGTVAGYGLITAGLSSEAVSTAVNIGSFTGQVAPAANVFMVIGGDSQPDSACEIALISGTSGTTVDIRRGILDTVPRAWPANTPCYFIKMDSSVTDSVIRSDGESVTYRALTRTFGGTLSYDAAPNLTGTLNGRPHYPLRPANVKVNSVAFGPVDLTGIDPIPVTWSNRNRTLENSQVVYWDDSTVTPETGQTTTIRVLSSPSRALLTEYTGLTGTSYNVPASALGAASSVIFQVASERDGFESLQAHEIVANRITTSTVYYTAGEPAEQTTTSATLTNLFSTTALAGQQQANATYLGFWGAEFQTSLNSNPVKIQITKNGTAVFPVNLNLRANYTTEYPAAGGMFVHSAGATPADATYAIQYATTSAATLKGRNAKLSWLRLGANDVVQTAYTTQTTASTTASNFATVNFTPPTTGDYLILCSFIAANSANTQSALVQLSDETTSSPEFTLFGDNSAHFAGMIPLKLTGVSGATSVSLKVRSSSTGNTVSVSNVVLVAIRLDRFAQSAINISGAASTGTDTTYTSAVSQTFTATAAKYFTLATWVTSAGGASSTSRVQVKYTDGALDVGATDQALVSSTANRAVVANTHQIADYGAGSRTQTISRASNAGATHTIAAGSGIITLSLAGLT